MDNRGAVVVRAARRRPSVISLIQQPGNLLGQRLDGQALARIGQFARAVIELAALILGTAVFVLLAAVSTALTRTVELAQLTTLPVLMLSVVFSGLLFPLAMLPGALRWLGPGLPLTPVVDLLRLGLTGTAPGGGHLGLAAAFGAAAIPVFVPGAWIVAGGWAARRWFRWEPRR